MDRTFLVSALAAALFVTGCSASARVETRKPVAVRPKPAPKPMPEPEPEPEPAPEPKKIEISENIQFHTDSARLRVRSHQVLDDVVRVMIENPEMMVEIQGHTDSLGPAYRNRRLSARRALRVQEYLIKRGIDARRLTAVGHGEERPLAENLDEEGRAENRRVDFVILDSTFDQNSDTEAADADGASDDDDDSFAGR